MRMHDQDPLGCHHKCPIFFCYCSSTQTICVPVNYLCIDYLCARVEQKSLFNGFYCSRKGVWRLFTHLQMASDMPSRKREYSVLLISDKFLFTPSIKSRHSSCLQHYNTSDFVTSPRYSKAIVPKIHRPAPLPLWQSYHASLAIAFITSRNRAAENSSQLAVYSLNVPACRFTRFFIKTTNAGLFFARHLYRTTRVCSRSVLAAQWGLLSESARASPCCDLTLPGAEWKLLQAEIHTTLVTALLKSHTFMASPPWCTRLNAMGCLVIGEMLRLNQLLVWLLYCRWL